METQFRKDALFIGMTANAFKLGTVLTGGWFWPRVGGCSMLYRGESMETIDFANVLAVADSDSGEISPPTYLQHEAGSVCFYVVRRVNCCGDMERTLSAAVKVSIDAEGDLAEPQPNGILDVKAEQVDGDRIRLVWFYCPLGQESPAAWFRIYGDGGTGQIDYESAVASVSYAGRKYYSYESESLNLGQYLFCIKAEDAAGTEGCSSAWLRLQLNSGGPGAIDILSIETV
ncbi:MAG TPA: hypothetical protein VMW16_04935 [Sedimentisphaerales bacterium]|nr:hypothetical protein [Sedimentisphaerales bacterium]